MTRNNGFTLIELMIVVAIIGLLAGVAIPVFVRYMTDSKKTEMEIALRRLADGAVVYFDTDQAGQDGMSVLPKGLPPTVALYPGTVSCDKKNPDIDWTPFLDLRFTMSKPFYGHYGWTNTSSGATYSGHALVQYDVDCDGTIAEQRINLAGGDDGMQSGVPIFITED